MPRLKGWQTIYIPSERNKLSRITWEIEYLQSKFFLVSKFDSEHKQISLLITVMTGFTNPQISQKKSAHEN